MIKKLLSGFLVTMLVANALVGATPTTANAATKVPKASYTFNMNASSKSVVAVARKGDTVNFTNTSATGGVLPDAANAKKIKLVYAKGKHGKALYLDRTSSYGAELKNVKLGSGSWTVSFWVKAANSMSDFMPVFFTESSVNDKDAKWLSVTKTSWLGNASPTIWSRNATITNAFPWFSNNEWKEGDEIVPANGWVHVVVVVNTKKKVTYGEGTTAYKGYQAYSYVNGKLYGNGAVAEGSMSNSNRFFLGINGWDVPFRGYIDDVQLWKSALSEKQVTALYKSQK